MRKIFVTYGDATYTNSMKRLIKEAETSGQFDEILFFNRESLPEEILSHPLLKYKRGGGYWLWKPWVILQAMKDRNPDDVVFYCDCGCKLFPHKEWNAWWKTMQSDNAIFFAEGGLMKQWSRGNMLSISPLNGGGVIHNLYQLISTQMFIKVSAKEIAQQWFDYMWAYPECIVDVLPEERMNEAPCFIEHRHDQAMLSMVVYNLLSVFKIKIFFQKSNSWRHGGQAIFNARISDERQRTLPIYEKRLVSIAKKYLLHPLRQLRQRYFIRKLKKYNNNV